jgi:hypothetical protein
MTAHLADGDRARLRRAGLVPLTNDEGLALFDAALVQSSPVVLPARLDLRAIRARGGVAPLLGLLGRLSRAQLRPGTPAPPPNGPSFAEVVADLPADEREAFLLDLLRGEIISVLGMSAKGPLDPDRPLKELGLDSLMAVELKNRIASRTSLRLGATLLFDHPTPRALVRRLLCDLGVGRTSDAPDSFERTVEGTDDEALFRLIDDKLGI